MIKIKKATLEDLDIVTPLFDQYRVFYRTPSRPQECREFVKERLSNQEATIFVALDEDGNGMGFTLLYPSFSSVSLKRIFVLNDLYVDNKYRRKGIGAGLLETAAAYGRSKGAIRLHLETEVSNQSAQALYEKEGWIKEPDTYHYNLQV